MKVLVFSSLLIFLLATSLVSALNYEETFVKAKNINKHTLTTIEKDQLKNRINETSRTWLRNGTTYPKSIVPIRRLISPNTIRENSTFNLERKQHPFRQLLFTGDHEFAVAIYDEPEGIYGVEATINLWNPSVETRGNVREYSTAQIRIKSTTNDEFDVIEAGWHVFPWYYSEDRGRTRFFISWTNDSYQRACYNLDCDGFVMLTSHFELGSAFEVTSSYNGEQEEIVVGIWKDRRLGRWSLRYNDILVGYWPEELFTHLRIRGTQAEWGGEVSNSKYNNRFTSTEMGSGHPVDEGYRKASYFKKLKVKTAHGGDNWISPQRLRGYVNNPQYYNMHSVADVDGLGNSGFFYGGPGNINNTS